MIQILQEVAAARQIRIICGRTEIDGYAFCLGLDSLNEFYEAHAELQSLIRSVTYLIRGAIFRPTHILSMTDGVPQAIGTLGELIDMYHNHKATLLHDKVYALLGMSGMSSDDVSKAKLLPNYQDEWEELLQRLVKFLLSENVSVGTWSGEKIIVIKSKSCILGMISSVQKIIALDGTQGVDIIFKNISGLQGYEKVWGTRWTLKPPAKPIRDGDFVCLLQGASKPTIIRSRKDHFVIIMIAVSPIEARRTELDYIECLELFPRDFLLVWDWGNSPESQDLGGYNAFVRTKDQVLQHPETNLGGYLNNAVRIWNVAMILEDVEEYKGADERVEEVIWGHEIAFGPKNLNLVKMRHGRKALSWAAEDGYDIVIKILLKEGNLNLNLEDSKSGVAPLTSAARNGHEAVVKLLLETGKVEVNSKDNEGRTPLSWAAENGQKGIVKLLLETGKVDVNSKDKYKGRAPLSWAVVNGHEAVVKLLLETGKVEIDSKDKWGETPLWLATKNRHTAIVKLLLEAGKADIDSKDMFSQTPLWWEGAYSYS